MKTRTWIVLFCLLALALGAATLFLLRDNGDAQTAEIWSDGVLMETVDLDADQSFTISHGADGYNLIVVEDGKIYVSEASCPDKVCIHHGPAAGGAPIVCLPNKLIIKFTGDDDSPDAVTG
ncbi:MAG: NusG domain II-containing protein [Oscillospiraceae bacterium]|nr:NusG domain II-containing protein [Oscillospiraceae bacterium]